LDLTTCGQNLPLTVSCNPAVAKVLIRLREITNLESGKATTRSKRRITAAV